MKHILFIIHSYQGTGGHYYSLSATATALSDSYKVHILNIGVKQSPVIEGSPLPHSYIYFSGKNFCQVARQIGALVKNESIDIIHCFDIASYLVAIFPARKSKRPIVLTKCGGPLLGDREYPVADNIILYNKTEYDILSKQKRFLNSNIELIPNRVLPFECNKDRITDFRERFGLHDKKVILRIGRIAQAYKMTAIESINLAKELHSRDPKYYLLIVGNVKDKEVESELLCLSKDCDFIQIITEDRYTINAKDYIDLAEIVVGTGRGFMEACQKNKKMFAPCKNSTLPVVVTSENVLQIMANNFSERYESTASQSIEQILDIIEGEAESEEWYKEYFSATAAVPKYVEYYSNLLPTKLHLSSLLYPIIRHAVSSIKMFSNLRHHLKK